MFSGSPYTSKDRGEREGADDDAEDDKERMTPAFNQRHRNVL
jgi:hypothetical protein